jgi:hypothetical protein
MPPISDDEFNKGKKYTGLRNEILNFLRENEMKAYTIVDLIENLRSSIPSLGASEKDIMPWAKNTLIYALQRHSFQLTLDDLIKDDLVKARLVDSVIYYKYK